MKGKRGLGSCSAFPKQCVTNLSNERLLQFDAVRCKAFGRCAVLADCVGANLTQIDRFDERYYLAFSTRLLVLLLLLVHPGYVHRRENNHPSPLGEVWYGFAFACTVYGPERGY